MNREIKFRAFSNNKMYHWETLQEKYNMSMWIKDNNLGDETLKLMEYTGLKDKNGQEIYEGDIVEGGFLNPLTDKFHSKKYLIEYKEKGAYYKGKLIGSSPYGDTWLKFIEGEVIGNIYENPELLEGK